MFLVFLIKLFEPSKKIIFDLIINAMTKVKSFEKFLRTFKVFQFTMENCYILTIKFVILKYLKNLFFKYFNVC